MIKFVRNHIFIVCSVVFLLVSGFFVISQSRQVKAAGADYNTMADQASTPDKQIASYAYYLALKECIGAGAFNLQINGTNISDVFIGQSKGVKVGYIAEKIAIDTAGAASGTSDIDGEIQCSTVAKAAFLLWGIGNSANITAELTGFGYTQKKSYSCIAYYDPNAGITGATGPQNWPILNNITLPYTNDIKPGTFTKGTVDTEDELDLFCESYAHFADGTYANSKGIDGAAHNWTESSSGQWTATKDTITGGFGRYIKGNVFETSYIASEMKYAEPSLDGNTGITYYLNKYYFQDANICAAVDKGLVSEIQFVSGSTTNKYDQLEVGKITSGAYGPYKEIPIIRDTTGVSDLHGYNMTHDNAKSGLDLPLWGNVVTNCNSVAESLKGASTTISDYINAHPGTTLYSSVITAAGTSSIIANSTSGSEKLTDGTVDETDSCGAQVAGVGWIMCPILNGLTGLNDGVWRLVTGLLTVSPLQQKDSGGTKDSGAYVAWGMIRNIANIVFVIIFLIMIFSQLSSAGISNYGIKKLLPRLIVGAILVNISFLIIQLAVDLSNIIGSGLYGLIQGVTPYAPPGWATLFNQLTIGAGAATLVGVATVFAAGNATAFWMLLPIAAVGLLGLIAAIVTLVFRKAAIIILAIFAPLAIVASLLPNTESWFKKWKDEFIQLLMLYPLAAVIFGGSQFAAGIIMSENPNNWMNNLMAMVITTLPLFSLPFLVTKGGKIMSTAGSALNKLVEKARNPIKSTAKSYEDEARAKYLAGDPSQRRTSLGRWQQSTYKRFQGKRKTRELNTKTDTEGFNSQWAGSTDAKMGDGFGANQRSQLSKDDAEKIQLASQDFYKKSVVGKQAIDDIGKLKMDIKVDDSDASTRLEKDEGLLNLRMKVKASESAYKAATDATSLIATEAATKSNAAHLGAIDYGTRKILQDSKRSSDLINIASNNAQRVQQSELADTLIKNIDLEGGRSVRDFAGGIDTEKGANSALANAIATKREAHNKVVTERNQMIKHFNVDGTGRQALSMGKQVRNKDTGVMEDVKGKDIDGNEFVFKQGDINTQEAAIETQMTIGSFPEFSEIIEASGEGEALHAFRTVIADAIPKNGINKKGPEFGGKFINKVSQGKAQGHKSTVIGAAEFLLDGKFQPEDMANSDGLSLKNMIEAATLYDKIDTATGKPYIPEFNLDDNGQIKKDANGNNINNYTVMKERIKKLKAIADLVLDPKTTVGKNRTDTATEQFEIMSKLGSNDNQEDYNI